eukprot:TRINITY_DN9004_c0_g1_i7.p3 TRINITY_DN9004_c0_g1~~TRINITY_DN9004_c0_g1_i7.p3  ORF type:complete len:134 (-),score=13.58 TRINITY_DN9004_c0_g1_i7:1108-1509(-)
MRSKNWVVPLVLLDGKKQQDNAKLDQVPEENKGYLTDKFRLVQLWRLLVRIVIGQLVNSPTTITERHPQVLELNHFRGDSVDSVTSKQWSEICWQKERRGGFSLDISLKTVLSLGKWKRPSNRKDVEMTSVQT